VGEQGNAQTDRMYAIVDKVLARLYLDLADTVGPAAVRARTRPTLDRADAYFAIERPSVSEIQHAVRERMARGQDLGQGPWLEYLGGELAAFYGDDLRARVDVAFDAILDGQEGEWPDTERAQLRRFVIEHILGFGPLEAVLSDGEVTEVLVDGPDRIYVERRGKLEDVPGRFRSEGHLMGVIHRILMPLGRKLDLMNPMVNVRLPDNSVVNVVIPPVSIVGPALTIRRFSRTPIAWEDLLRWGSVSEDVVTFLRACVCARLNVVVSGGTASGKTTMLNRITEMIPTDERVITIERVMEVQPSRDLEHIVRMECRPPDAEGRGAITMRDLVIRALRMRPDRIIGGEVQGAEVLDLLQAMNTGHDGCLITMHANGPHDALARLETMALMARPGTLLRNVRHQIASAIHLILYQERLRDGTRKVVKLSEVAGVQGDVIAVQDIFEFRETGSKEGKVAGYHTATGIIPRHLNRIRRAGIELPIELFAPR
jgi:pilus assembly protein CpaF